MAHTTVVSSPGKVLVSGGYLVLDREYSGTVVSTSSRFYTVIQEDASRGANNIRVRSPQFSSATWEYFISMTQSTVKVEEAPTNIPMDAFSVAYGDGRLLAHNLAQYIHCYAQGKVGSGFDVAAAVFGSHIYTRFNPAVLNGLMNEEAASPNISLISFEIADAGLFSMQLNSKPLYLTLSPSNKAWDYTIKPFKLPPLTRLMLADVDAGSDTPTLVGKVLKWRTENPEKALALWTDIDRLNTRLAETLAALSGLYEKDASSYITALKYIASLQPIQWLANPYQPEEEKPTIAKFYDAHMISRTIRIRMKEMGELSGVPIEPAEQTKLLNSCVSLAGVIGGGVPGAGGYDAIWLLVCDPIDSSPDIPPVQRVEQAWSEYTELDVSPLSAKESFAHGVCVESVDAVIGLAAVTTLPS
ncbi:hypothetical protein C0992_011073 [Termitomyces sp. T32_za158]|nr:hypothetical protein C0992_011073 [Termitomyces sp. T32_za158]